MTKKKNYEVLVVDDVLSAANDYARLIETKIGLQVAYTSDVEEALKYVQYNDMKVLVLDQKMPVTGTQLLEKLRPFTSARAIMLTGEADKEDLGNAINLNFHAYVDKSKVTQLPDVVFSQYTKFLKDYKERIKHSKKEYVNWSIKTFDIVITYKLEDVILDYAFVDNKQRKTLCQILSGQQKESGYELETAKAMIVETNTEKELSFSVKGPKDNLLSSLDGTIKKVLNIKNHLSTKKTFKHSTKYCLTSEDEKNINQRIIEYEPVYEVHRILLCHKFMRTKDIKTNLVIVRKFTGKYQILQTDYLKDKTVDTKVLGVHGFENF